MAIQSNFKTLRVGFIRFYTFVLLFLSVNVGAQTIISFTPQSGPVGTEVTITGTGFAAAAADNKVYFGALTAGITSASTNQLVVTVPAGAAEGWISVLANGLTIRATVPFSVTYSRGGDITVDSFMPFVSLETGVYTVYADFDGDGKLDLLVDLPGAFSIHMNISTDHDISMESFAEGIDFPLEDGIQSVSIVDVDNDGKPDLAIVGNTGLTILRNVIGPSGVTNNSFPKISFTPIAPPFTVHNTLIEDLDRDGYNDLIVSLDTQANGIEHKLLVFEVDHAAGTGAGDLLTISAEGIVGIELAIGDLDGDLKPDIVSITDQGEILIFQNHTEPGTIDPDLLSAPVSMQTDARLWSLAIQDMNGDNKPELAMCSHSVSTGTVISTYRNIASGPFLSSNSFSSKVDFGGDDLYPQTLALGDLNGDGKPDIGTTPAMTSQIVILQNTTVGQGNELTFGSPVIVFESDILEPHVGLKDMNYDGKQDLLVPYPYGILQNKITRPIITSISPASGRAKTTVVVRGHKFDSKSTNNLVTINGQEVTMVTSAADSLSITVPVGATTGRFVVTVTGEKEVSSEIFVVTSIKSFFPLDGVPGTRVFIQGYDFDRNLANNTVTFGMLPALVEASTDTTLTAIVPIGAFTSFITVTAKGVTSKTSTPFRVFPPIITSVTPNSGPIGATVTISGAHFDPEPANNIVHFGGVRATMNSASASELRVSVPAASTYELLSVSSNGLSVKSSVPFVVTSPQPVPLDTSSFSKKISVPVADAPLALFDLDNDGKLDIITGAAILANSSEPSSVVVSAPWYLQTGTPQDIDVGDIDGDGKPEIVLANGSNGFSIFKNNSSPGTLSQPESFQHVAIVAGISCSEVAIGDLDGDGKPDLAITSGKEVIVFKNKVTGHTITPESFDTPIVLRPEGIYTNGEPYPSFSDASDISICDLNADHKPEIVFACVAEIGPPLAYLIGASVYTNKSVLGEFDQDSFSQRIHFPIFNLGKSQNLTVGDINSDGKPDIAIRNSEILDGGVNHKYYFEGLTVLQGTGNISFDLSELNAIDVGTFDYQYAYGSRSRIKLGDLNGDGKLDLLVGSVGQYFAYGHSGAPTFGTNVVPNVTGSTIDLKTVISLKSKGNYIAMGDIDGDGAQDLVTTGGVYQNLHQEEPDPEEPDPEEPDPEEVTAVSDAPQEIAIYPLPATERLIIKGVLIPQDGFDIISSVGKTLRPPIEHTGDDSAIDLSGVATGLYILRIHTDNNVVVFKFIKE
jgi:hypothetical protein